MKQYRCLNLTQLGKLFDGTSHDAGKWLKKIGLRTNEGKPSTRAFEEGFTEQTDNGRGGYYWVWNTKKTIAALEAAGHTQVNEDACEVPARLRGPFELEASESEIINGDGKACLQVVAATSDAKRLVEIMNLAHTHGVL